MLLVVEVRDYERVKYKNMSDYYKITRQPDWNYGGKRWKLSRSKIDLFIRCPK